MNSLVNLPCSGVGYGMGIVFSKCTRVHNFKFCENLSCYDYDATDDETGFLTVFGATKAK